MAGGKLFTDEQKRWVRDNQRLMTIQQMTEAFNHHFGESRTTASIATIRGFRRAGSVRKPFFGKKAEAHNRLPDGAERLRACGYIAIKTPAGFKYKHRYIWEQTNGPIPPAHIIRFIDGNPHNCDLSNLECVPRAAMTRVARRYGALPPDLRSVAIAAMRLDMAVQEAAA